MACKNGCSRCFLEAVGICETWWIVSSDFLLHKCISCLWCIWYWIIVNQEHVGKRLSIVKQRFPFYPRQFWTSKPIQLLLRRYQRVDPYFFRATQKNTPQTTPQKLPVYQQRGLQTFRKQIYPFCKSSKWRWVFLHAFWYIQKLFLSPGGESNGDLRIAKMMSGRRDWDLMAGMNP